MKLFFKMSATILDLPLEVLEMIFSYLHLNLQDLMELTQVCRKFRVAVLSCPIPIRLPLQDEQLLIVSKYQIPISSLYNEQPSLYVQYQVSALNMNMCRLHEAQLVANDYLPKSNLTQLSPHYMAILLYLTVAKNSLRKLIVNVDLSTEDINKKSYNCAKIIGQFKNLRFLSLHFTAQIELQEKIKAVKTSQENIQKNFIQYLLCKLPKLKTLYINSCPVHELSIKSSSLEKLCLYKSEFVNLKYLNTPKLKTLMFHEGMNKFFKKIRENELAGVKSQSSQLDIFKVIYHGCPNIENFNNGHLGVLKPYNLTEENWCQNALKICYKRLHHYHH